MKRRALLGAVGVVATVSLAGCGGGGNGDDPTATPTESNSDFSIDSSELSVDGGVATVTGEATNTSGGSLAFAEIRATFLDGDGNELGAQRATKTYWNTNDTWEFEITYDEDDADAAADYQLEKDADSGT